MHIHTQLRHVSPDDIWFCLHPLFASDVSSPFSLCPLGLPAKIFGKTFVVVLPVWWFGGFWFFFGWFCYCLFFPSLMLLWALLMTNVS